MSGSGGGVREERRENSSCIVASWNLGGRNTQATWAGLQSFMKNNNVDVLCAFEVRMRQHHLGFSQQLMLECDLRLFSPLHDSRTHLNSLLLVTKKTASERFKVLHVDKEAKWIFLETAINSHPTTIAFVHAPAT